MKRTFYMHLVTEREHSESETAGTREVAVVLVASGLRLCHIFGQDDLIYASGEMDLQSDPEKSEVHKELSQALGRRIWTQWAEVDWIHWEFDWDDFKREED